jgi:hypothetical protein
LDDRPAHFDTVRVNPTGELSELVDLLARSAGLVPFEQLSESEKEFDRQTARETVKMLLAMGYTIQPPSAKRIPPPVSSSPPEMEWVRLNGILNGVVAPKLAELEAVWNVRNPDVWSQSVELFRRLGERILEMGEPLLAYDVLVEGLRYFPSDVCLRRLVALALSRTGAIDTANTILVKLYEDGHQDEETLGLLASTYKDLAGAAEDATRRQELLGRAQQFYARAYELTHGYWSGINVATLAVVFDEHDRAQVVARDVRATCREELKRLEENGGDPYWPWLRWARPR